MKYILAGPARCCFPLILKSLFAPFSLRGIKTQRPAAGYAAPPWNSYKMDMEYWNALVHASCLYSFVRFPSIRCKNISSSADETNTAIFSVSLYLTMMWKVKAVHNIQTIKEECYSNPPITTNDSKNVQVFQVWYLFYTTFSYLYLICT